MATVHVESETPIDRGWSFLVRVGPSDDAPAPDRFVVRLSWADYDHWSRGRVAPEAVAAAVLTFLLERAPAADIPREFDAATIRRRHPAIDAELPGML